VNVGVGPSQVIIADDIVGINAPGPPRMINFDMSGDSPSTAQLAKLQRSYVVVGD
jgi:hypothetical protein